MVVTIRFHPSFMSGFEGDANENPVVWSQNGSLSAYEGQMISLSAGAYDNDGDEIFFTWDLGGWPSNDRTNYHGQL